MRKWITVAAAAVLVGMIAQPVAAQMSLGIHAGAVNSKFTGNGINNAKYRLGFMAGAQLGFALHESFGIAIGANYVMAGADSVTFTPGGAGSDISLSYIDVPLLFVAAIQATPAFKVGPYVGVQAGLKMSCKSGAAGGSLTTCPDDTAKSMVVAIPAGVGFGWAIGESGMIILDARFNLGVTKAFETTEAKNQYWQLMLRYQFALGG